MPKSKKSKKFQSSGKSLANEQVAVKQLYGTPVSFTAHISLPNGSTSKLESRETQDPKFWTILKTPQKTSGELLEDDLAESLSKFISDELDSEILKQLTQVVTDVSKADPNFHYDDWINGRWSHK